jgi:hypothetical protein
LAKQEEAHINDLNKLREINATIQDENVRWELLIKKQSDYIKKLEAQLEKQQTLSKLSAKKFTYEWSQDLSSDDTLKFYGQTKKTREQFFLLLQDYNFEMLLQACDPNLETSSADGFKHVISNYYF